MENTWEIPEKDNNDLICFFYILGLTFKNL